MRNVIDAITTSRFFANSQDSRIVAGTRIDHAPTLVHALPAWRLYAAQAAWCASAIERAMKSASASMARRLKRSVRSGSPVAVVERVGVQPAPGASVGRV